MKTTNEIIVIFIKGEMYPAVLADKNGFIDCPFCKHKHGHGKAGQNGHRLSHCVTGEWKDISTEEGITIKKENGYYVYFNNVL